MKHCKKCNTTKPLDCFYKHKSTKDGYRSECKVCTVDVNRTWHKNNKERRYKKNRDTTLRKSYCITSERYEEILKEQNNKCKICGVEYSSGKRFPVDHCHTTGKVRGILCSNCNTGLGMFKDNPKYLDFAIKYLKESIND